LTPKNGLLESQARHCKAHFCSGDRKFVPDFAARLEDLWIARELVLVDGGESRWVVGEVLD
jgi:hypothetical protein